MLVATTYGRGTFAIRLDDQPAAEQLRPRPAGDRRDRTRTRLGGPSDRLQVQFSGPVDPVTFDPGRRRPAGRERASR